MRALEELITEALTSTTTDNDLAKALVNSGALAEIINRGTYSDSEVQARLNYPNRDTLRAALSRAKRGRGKLPLPVIDTRLWSKTAIDSYRRSSRRGATADTRPSTSFSSTTSSGGSTSIRGTTSTTSNRHTGGIRGSGSDVDSGSVTRGTSDTRSTSAVSIAKPGSTNGAEDDAHYRAEQPEGWSRQDHHHNPPGPSRPTPRPEGFADRP